MFYIFFYQEKQWDPTCAKTGLQVRLIKHDTLAGFSIGFKFIVRFWVDSECGFPPGPGFAAWLSCIPGRLVEHFHAENQAERLDAEYHMVGFPPTGSPIAGWVYNGNGKSH